MFVFVELAPDLELFVVNVRVNSKEEKTLLGHNKEHVNLEGKFMLHCGILKSYTYFFFLTLNAYERSCLYFESQTFKIYKKIMCFVELAPDLKLFVVNVRVNLK